MNYPILYHYTKSEETPVPYYAVQDTKPFTMKPNGIWLTPDIEDNWEQWCRGEGFNLENLRFRHKITIKDDANILWIKNAAELDSFERKYMIDPPVELTFMRGHINWLQVTTDYQGILITPYIWERRLGRSSLWYYGWDCASGCFWSPNVFKRIERDTSYVDIGQKLLS